MSRALINVPARARRGEVIQIRTLIQHEMETGFRPLPNGGFAPRLILRRFECVYDGEVVFAADLHPAISANPFLAFRTVATRSGELLFRWIDDRGAVREERAAIEVECPRRVASPPWPSWRPSPRVPRPPATRAARASTS